MSRLACHISEELAEPGDKTSLQGHIQNAASVVFSWLKKLWLTELYVAEETVVIEGTKVVKPVTVTVAKAVKALIILVVGVWIARRLMKPLRWLVIHKFKQNQSRAVQISAVTFLILFIAVCVFSLVSVNIPLAVFAFLGGALAIGVGFGAQNLINNFISGIILLFDRSISVGDLIEVDGQGGKVMAIGMRSSHVQRFDGVEMLVPNSQFLQQKVINWTHSERQMRYAIEIGVAYGSPVRKVKELLLQVI
jgi:small-conductance mechanosensitive channel